MLKFKESGALSILYSFFGINKREKENPTLPLQDKDIQRVNLNWLSQYITNDMQQRFENERLKSNNRKRVYLPDKRIVLNSIMNKTLKSSQNIFDYFSMRFEFLDEKGNKNRIRLLQNCFILFEPLYLYNSGKAKYGSENIQKSYTKEIGTYIAKAYAMALILDSIVGTKLRDKVFLEFSKKMKNTHNRKILDTDKLKLISELNKCFDRLDMEYRNIERPLEKKDKKIRDRYYRNNPFEEIKAKGLEKRKNQGKNNKETSNENNISRQNSHTSNESR